MRVGPRVGEFVREGEGEAEGEEEERASIVALFIFLCGQRSDCGGAVAIFLPCRPLRRAAIDLTRK